MRIYRAAALALPLTFLVACHTPAQEHAATVAPAAYGRDPYVAAPTTAVPAPVPVADGVVVPPTTQRATRPVARAHPAPAELPADTDTPATDPPAPPALPECWHYKVDDHGNLTGMQVDPDPTDDQDVPPTKCRWNPTPQETQAVMDGPPLDDTTPPAS